MILISILIYVLLFLHIKKRVKSYFFLPGFIFASILIIGQLVYLISYTTDFFSGVNYFASYKFTDNFTVYLYNWLLLLVCYFSVFRLRDTESAYKRVKKVKVKKTALTKTFFSQNFKTYTTYFFVFCALWIMCIIHMSAMNLSILWENNKYKLISDADALNLPPAAHLIHLAAGILAIAILIYIILLNKSKLYVLAAWLVPLFLYFFLLKLAANSRWAPLIIASAIPFLYKRDSLKSRFQIFLTSVAALISYLSAFQGRHGGSYSQGIAAIYTNIKAGIQFIAPLLSKITVATFSNSLNLDVTLVRFSQQTVFFDPKYKLLSFSPLISQIDGFDALKSANVLRITSFIPVGFMGEIYYFGTVYLVFALALLYYCIRYCNKIVIKHDLIGVFAVTPIFVFFLLMQDYPVRLCMRFVYIAVIMGFLLNTFRKKPKKPAPLQVAVSELQPIEQ